MTSTDGVITLWPPGRPNPVDGPLPDVMTFDSEFIVDWQVADRATGGPPPDRS